MNTNELQKLQKEVAEIKKLLHQYKSNTPSEEWFDSADLKTHFHFRKANFTACAKPTKYPIPK
jgi:hypothetical protein